MLIYQLIDVLISVLDHCNTLSTNNHHSSDELREQSQLITSEYFYKKNLHRVIHTNIKHRMATHLKFKKINNKH